MNGHLPDRKFKCQDAFHAQIGELALSAIKGQGQRETPLNVYSGYPIQQGITKNRVEIDYEFPS